MNKLKKKKKKIKEKIKKKKKKTLQIICMIPQTFFRLEAFIITPP